ncbi:hypothetical protein KKI24_17525 [bacterium]|nr:hypothetical protein [bacterium]
MKPNRMEPVSEFRLATDSGSYDLEARVLLLGDDLLVVIWGGDTPHIGAVAMAQSRPSLKDAAELSATSSVYTYIGHKEDDLVKKVSETLSKKLDKKVVVAAGIHWDNIPESGIRQVMINSGTLIQTILDLF